ncbi:MAG: peroxidase [Acidobacteriota bacterium]|nr:peroxidase [Acidobacteriota bacterium]
MADSILTRTAARIGEFFTGRSTPWHKLPVALGIIRLFRIRDRLRSNNLHDTYEIPSIPAPPLGQPNDAVRLARTVDGTFNDVKEPRMGSRETRFGRSVPLNEIVPDEGAAMLTPSPRTVSLELMTRHKFQPATTINLLVAPWIQFMVHDWLSHGKNEKENPFEIPLKNDDPWTERPMLVRRTRRDPTRPPALNDSRPTFVNTETHWWDASQMYGSDQATLSKLRSGERGKLRVEADGLLPVDPRTGIDLTGVTGNWWVGLSMLHTLFALEHNAVCDRLFQKFPKWTDEELFSHARLVIAALLAKIHTIEWTPALLSHPTTVAVLNGNWLTIPRSSTDHHGVPYSMPEEFVAVYRMHPLMPDEFTLRSVTSGATLQQLTLPDVMEGRAREIMNQISLTDLFYSFGTMHPGALTLHNYPRFMQRLERPDAPLIDLASVDILRDRERGVPRYNRFRRLIDMPPAESFEDLTDNKQWVEELRRVYNNDINKVDLMVGLYAEKLPEGFAFSETAFRIFILIATRRLKSDRFFTRDYRPEIYTQIGLDWIHDNTMATVLKRHFPALERPLRKVKNAFAPWQHTI